MKHIHIERTFLEITKRFLEPMKLRKKEYFKHAIQAFLWWINGVIHVLFLERVIYHLEIGNSEWFHDIIIYYTLYITIYEVVNFSIKKWWWMNTLPFTIADNYNKYLNKYIQLDNNTTELVGTGKLIWIIWDGSRTWALLITNILEKWMAVVVSILFTTYMIARVDILYSIAFFTLIFLCFSIAIFSNNRLKYFRKDRYEYRNIRLKQFVKIVMSKMEILQTGKMNWEMDAVYKNTQKISNVSKKMSFYRVIMKRTAPFGITLLLLTAFYYLWWQILAWTMNLWVLVWLSGALIIMQRSISETVSFYVEFTKEFVNIEKMWDFFDLTPEIEWYDTWRKFIHSRWEVEVKNLSYAYNEWGNVFTNFSLKIPGEQVTAIVGVSGGGKSTLVKLISGYIRADSGEIIIDGQKLSKVSLKSYYKDIGYLTQEPSVFDGTVLENLTYALTKAPAKKKLDEIIKLAKCEFVYDFPNWLETEIWEKWIRLSWGQRQRLAIAKIFLKDPKIIILDEPTSALDSFSEEQITIAMHNLFKWRTVIIIAHRLQTVKSAADIILIEDWQVQERGTHSELVKKKWIYKKMLDLQSWF